MTFAIAAAVTALVLFIVSQIERRKRESLPWLGQVVMGLRLLVLVFVALYIYFRVTS